MKYVLIPWKLFVGLLNGLLSAILYPIYFLILMIVGLAFKVPAAFKDWKEKSNSIQSVLAKNILHLLSFFSMFTQLILYVVVIPFAFVAIFIYTLIIGFVAGYAGRVKTWNAGMIKGMKEIRRVVFGEKAREETQDED